MATILVTISSNYQITIPKIVRKKLNIKKGDHLLLGVQDGVIVLIPEPSRYTTFLRGLHSEIWEGIDVEKYMNGERGAWTNSASE